MEYKTLTVKIPADLMNDLDMYSAQEFVRECRACRGTGEAKGGGTCGVCGGGGLCGSRSEAVRFLIHYALGQSTTPEARAMMAAYTEIHSRFFEVITNTRNRMEEDFRSDVLRAIKAITKRP